MKSIATDYLITLLGTRLKKKHVPSSPAMVLKNCEGHRGGDAGKEESFRLAFP